MSEKRDRATESAFPFHDGFVQGGLTKREYFAGLAMQGICIGEAWPNNAEVARRSVLLADALLAELESK